MSSDSQTSSVSNTIVVAVRDQVICRHVKAALMPEGFDVIECLDASLVTVVLHTFQPALLVLENSICGSDPECVVNELLQDSALCRIPILFVLTSRPYEVPEWNRKYIDAEISYRWFWVTMPFGNGELASFVRRILQAIGEKAE